MNRRIILAIVAVLLLGAGVYFMGNVGSSLAQTSDYSPPKTEEGEDGWLTYVDAPETGPDNVGKLNPAPSSPEAAVVKFLASRMRGDNAWEEALVADRSARLERQIAEWEEWTIDGFQLRGRKPTGGDGVYLRVFFRITVNDDSDSGTDEFELVPDGNEWRIAGIPT